MITINELAEKLGGALLKELPGTGVQWEMASSDRMVQGFPREKNKNSRLGAVLILLYPSSGTIKTVFIQRPVYNGVHSGQIAFPGGKMEAGDSSLVETALREACEETGICSDDVVIIGKLTPLFIHVSDIEVTQVVAFSNKRPDFNIDPGEVVSIIEADMDHFTDQANISEMPMKIADQMIRVKYFDFRGDIIWGATAMILYELVSVIRNEGITFRE